MSLRDAHDPVVLRGYESLVRSTALLIVSDLRWRGVTTADDDLDDVMQALRMKVWRALWRFSPERVKRKKGESLIEARDRYVFMCVTDTKKDIFKRKRTLVLMIEDQAPARADHDPGPRDAFDARYLAQSEEETFGSVEAALPLIPNTLSDLERGVLLLLYRDFTHREIALKLGISRSDVSTAVRSLKAKLGDWEPPRATLPAEPELDPVAAVAI